MIYKENIIVCVDDLSKEFNKSKATIYKKLKSNKELIKPIIRKDRKTYISAEAVKWLKNIYDSKSINSEKDVKNNLNCKNIEENKIEKEKTVVNTDENNINSSLSNNLIHNEILKEDEQKETICNLENSTLNTIERNEINNPLIIPTEKICDNIVDKKEAIPTAEFLSKERIPLSLDNEVFGLLKSYVKFLETECNTKNKQLDSKDDIIKNMQVLLENEQEIVCSQVNLEERCREMDDKLFQLKGQLENRKKKQKKSFLKKLFKL
ncbi:hypothetical protein [Clostridium tarantellae]|uniref:Uncharacterized protein n=1 Tax=Clostridium tarantellae TaxID=39493 RepID=A0A6I1MND2_9CLOT|nr:hypothetical protein [Clostridium tarantellae]MPQ44915.1 hypothetical protein [Clostridium tarantellae]